MPFKPYFYVLTKPDTQREVISYLQRKFSKIYKLEVIKKEDLDLVRIQIYVYIDVVWHKIFRSLISLFEYEVLYVQLPCRNYYVHNY